MGAWVEQDKKPLRDAKGRLLPGSTANRSGRSTKYKEIKKLAESHAAKAIETLAEIMLSPLESAKVKIQASNSILDRAFGKPTTVQDVTFKEPSDEDGINRPSKRLSREEWLRAVINDKKEALTEDK